MNQLTRWADCLKERNSIAAFIEWLQDKHRDLEVLDLHPERLLDEYHGIDRVKLDEERRGLLDKQREALGGQ